MRQGELRKNLFGAPALLLLFGGGGVAAWGYLQGGPLRLWLGLAGVGLGLTAVVIATVFVSRVRFISRTIARWDRSGVLGEYGDALIEPGERIGSMIVVEATDLTLSAVTRRGVKRERFVRCFYIVAGLVAALGAVLGSAVYLNSQPGGLWHARPDDLKDALTVSLLGVISLAISAYGARPGPIAWVFSVAEGGVTAQRLVWGTVLRTRHYSKHELRGWLRSGNGLWLELTRSRRERLTDLFAYDKPTRGQNKRELAVAEAIGQWWGTRVWNHARVILDPIGEGGDTTA